MTKQKPILMSAESVRAILDGVKTQTRRVIKPQPEWRRNMFDGTYAWTYKTVNSHQDGWRANLLVYAPYQPGAVLWVRETWAALSPHDERAPLEECIIEYKADTGAPYPGNWPADEARGNPDAPKWRSPIHMRKWMARLWLEVTDVRVQRLQDITPGDIIDEGFQTATEAVLRMPEPGVFVREWNELNAKRGYSWESDPWVWAYTFKKVDAPP